MLSALLLLLLLGASPWARAAELPENEAAARMAADAMDFLDRLLGPNRARVFITLDGERSQVQTQSEVATPMSKPKPPPAEKALPGYVPKEQESQIDYYQKDVERSQREGSFKIKKMQVSVVLDSLLPDAQVQHVKKVLPDFLRMTPDRGDDMVFLRAPMLPPWKAAFMDAEGVRRLGAIAVATLLGLLFCLTLYVTGIGAMRTLAREISASRTPLGEGAPALPQAPGAAQEAGGSPIDLGGDIPGLLEEGGEPGGRPLPALGRRFDFLSAKEPQELARILETEKPLDIAILFAHLADSNPDLATKIFSALPPTGQAAVSQSLVKLSRVEPDQLSMLETRLQQAVEFGVEGGERLGRIFSRLPSDERNALMGELMSSDPAAAETVERSMLTFENLAELKAEDFRRLIMAVHFQEWGTALRGAPPEFTDRILSELPPGARAMIEDSLRQAQPRDKVLEARSKVLLQAYQLSAKGQISLKRQGAEPELI
ncbi:MAG: FliG C-terminal domain-containing protein [Elusimicrobiota bacterium]|jgi:hypothetical protein